METIIFLIIFFSIPIGIGLAIKGIYCLITGKKCEWTNNTFSSDYKHNLDSSSSSSSSSSSDYINPATGSMMIGGIGGVDAFGNSFGSSSMGGFND